MDKVRPETRGEVDQPIRIDAMLRKHPRIKDVFQLNEGNGNCLLFHKWSTDFERIRSVLVRMYPKNWAMPMEIEVAQDHRLETCARCGKERLKEFDYG